MIFALLSLHVILLLHQDKAEDFVDHALEDCGVEKLHIVHMGGLEEGENAFGDVSGVRALSVLVDVANN